MSDDIVNEGVRYSINIRENTFAGLIDLLLEEKKKKRYLPLS